MYRDYILTLQTVPSRIHQDTKTVTSRQACTILLHRTRHSSPVRAAGPLLRLRSASNQQHGQVRYPVSRLRDRTIESAITLSKPRIQRLAERICGLVRGCRGECTRRHSRRSGQDSSGERICQQTDDRRPTISAATRRQNVTPRGHIVFLARSGARGMQARY